MNTRGNQRTVQTEQKIKWVFLELLNEKELNRISVSEICQKANIHRTTFYVHYKDVADLMEQLIREMYEQIMGFFVQEGEPVKSDGFLRLFELIKERKEFFSTYLEVGGSLDLGYESQEELFYHQTFFCEGLSAVIRRWIRRDCRESPEEMRRIIVKEYNPNAELFLR